MLKLFVRDNTNGCVHEYGTDPHDALILQDDGSLHYEHLQCGVGTMFPEEGFSFCKEDGTIPQWGTEYGCAPYIDIGGECYKKPMTNEDIIRNMSTDELANFIGVVARNGWTRWVLTSPKEWLQQPTEGE